MRTTRHSTFVSLAAVAVLLAACSSGGDKSSTDSTRTANGNAGGTASSGNASSKCAGDNAGLTLSSGFCASIFADSIGKARHLVVAPNGVVYVTLESMDPSPEQKIGGQPQAPAPRGVAALRDANGDGKADTVAYFGDRGETGIDLYNGQLYVDQGNRIVRFRLDSSALTPTAKPEVIVQGIPTKPGHVARNFTIDQNGTLYLNVGSSTNACQPKDRQPGLAGQDPCRELATRAGVFRFDANKTGQTFSSSARFATGLRNGMGLRVNPNGGKLWATQHGRDGLYDYWKGKFPDSTKYQAENPAEELVQVNQNDDFGWPYCYWAVDQKKLVDAPEYGGDGKKSGRCDNKKEPIATYGGHWAPMSLFFYTGNSFPGKYKNGAFIAFHGSWNRAPEQQAPGRIVFQPLNGEKSSGDYEMFAEGFAGVPANEVQPGTAKHRPVGIAQAPDGSIYVSDDLAGRIYRITYNGGK